MSEKLLVAPGGAVVGWGINFAQSGEGIAFNGAFYPAGQGFSLVDPPAAKPADFEPGRYQCDAGILVRIPDPPPPAANRSRRWSVPR